RASRADHEQAIGTLKAAFVQGRLTKDELDERAGRALVPLTYAELAALTGDLPDGADRGPAASFDDPNLVSRAGLVPVMALAQRAGLTALAGEHVRIGRRCGVNAQVKVACVVAGMVGGADSI